MKKLLILFLLIPVICNAQVKELRVQVLDLKSKLHISCFDIKVGNRNEKAIPFYNKYAYYPTPQLNDLNDTLYIFCDGYSVDALPIAYHDFTFEEDAVQVKVYAKPACSHYLEYDLPMSLSYDTQNDSVKVKAFCSGYGTAPEVILQFKDNADEYSFQAEKYNKGFYQRTFAYDDLQNGTFQVCYENKVDTFEFDVSKWYQTQYLIPKPAKPAEREYRLIQSYFEYVSKSQKAERVQRRKFEHEKDSLISVIYRLQGKVREEYPYPEEPELEDMVFAHERAQPKGGFDYFFEQLEKKLPRHIKFAGNITLELEVMKDGYVRYEILHSMKGAEKILSEIRSHLRNEKWQPAKYLGRAHNQKIILSLNVLPDELSISQTEKFKPEEGMTVVDLKTSKTIRLEVGQKLYYQASVHGSIGIWANAISENEEVLQRTQSHLAYDRPLTPGMTGDDSATRTFVFEAKKAGKTTLHLKRGFRGENRGEQSIKIIVR